MDEVGRSHIIRNFLSKDVLDLFFHYSYMLAKKDNVYNQAATEWSTKYEPTVGHCIDIRGNDMLANAILVNYLPTISEHLKIELHPVSSFYRIYGHECELPMHKDNPEYEWSATICMGYEATECWPLYIKKEPWYLEPGECLLYQGAKDLHGRKKFNGSWQSQLFLHYKEVKDEQRQEKNS